MRVGIHTGIAVLEVGSILVVGGADNRHNALVQVNGLVVGLLVVRRGEVAVGARHTIVTATAALEPALVLSFIGCGSITDGVDGNILISTERSLNLGSIGKSLGLASRRVQALEESQGRVVQDSILGCGDLQLRQDGVVAADARDADRSIRLDIALPVEGSG